jgi:hypothetical protein
MFQGMALAIDHYHALFRCCEELKVAVLNTPLQILHKPLRSTFPTKDLGEWELFPKQDGQLVRLREHNDTDADMLDSCRGKNQTIIFIQMFV